MTTVHAEPAAITQPADPDKLNAFLGRMVGDLGAIASGALVLLGDRLGLYRAMRSGEPMTPTTCLGCITRPGWSSKSIRMR